ncbi:Uncharacterized protein TCM_029334 [Theobroma cacao]|uniref:Uncharacterized protein n=1 Tax=Theobroma cacao TaxID=3641 RepID=A0A061GDK7_THECC|nr:Uncharacterized protein TCM_029334 [Theobroma cacao]
MNMTLLDFTLDWTHRTSAQTLVRSSSLLLLRLLLMMMLTVSASASSSSSGKTIPTTSPPKTTSLHCNKKQTKINTSLFAIFFSCTSSSLILCLDLEEGMEEREFKYLGFRSIKRRRFGQQEAVGQETNRVRFGEQDPRASSDELAEVGWPFGPLLT